MMSNSSDKNESTTPYLSIIVPFLNESENLAKCHHALLQVLDKLPHHSEIVYIDDGSTDDSWLVACSLHSGRHSLRVIRLSRNFGKECALSAGLLKASGSAVIPFDADLQDPPECIFQMVEEWESGYDIIEMQRTERLGETFCKKLSAKLFYKTLSALSDSDINENVGDFRLLDRKVVQVINSMPERNRFMKGLLSWPGFKRKVLTFQRAPRHAGTSKWNYFKLFKLAFEGITSFSTKPLRLATFAGVTTSLIAFIYSIIVLTKTVIWGDPVAGYPSLLIVVLLIGGVQLLSIGLLGEYVGRLFIESKQRPLYVVMEEIFKESKDSPQANESNISHINAHQDIRNGKALSGE
ncbi:glycosyltransferase family 2 protein [Rhodanobacter aciditrophus]|uniref:Glycosyltransferase family 2 protein n=1 Tax=Rhodanobacter aciditrophus TaxID=1623218 RepID=A0ABW4B437_9GAMM